MRYYNLIGDEVVEVDDPLPCRTVELTENHENTVKVSTVFLSIDHSHTNTGPPVLFETMVFGGENDEYFERYETIQQARAGHLRVCAETPEVAQALIIKLTEGSSNGE